MQDFEDVPSVGEDAVLGVVLASAFVVTVLMISLEIAISPRAPVD
jgi:hypothetical protein